jgi:hypothetical protein
MLALFAFHGGTKLPVKRPMNDWFYEYKFAIEPTSDYLDFVAFFRVLPSSRHHPGEHAFNVARSQFSAGAMECSRSRFYFRSNLAS